MRYVCTCRSHQWPDSFAVNVSLEEYQKEAALIPRAEGESDFSYRKRVLQGLVIPTIIDWEMEEDPS